MNEGGCRVCVTGGAGYIGSWLVRKLLHKGYIVHATLRDLGDPSKVEILKRLSSGAHESRLLLFEADLYNAKEFEPAIHGCQFVFLVATPMQHDADNTRYKDTTEAAVGAVRIILESCKRSCTVRRVIYTGSVTSSSPLKQDGTGFKEFMDESCWTPLHLSFAHCGNFVQSYTSSKTSAEKALLSSNDEEDENRLEVVSLICGLVGGDSLLPNGPLSIQSMTSPLTGNAYCYKNLMFLQALLGSIPLVHIEDLCNAHIFCMEKSSMSGRYICAGAYPTLQDLQDYYEQKYSVPSVIKEVEGNENGIPCNSQKLIDAGFKYAYDMKKICDGSVDCMKRLEALNEII